MGEDRRGTGGHGVHGAGCPNRAGSGPRPDCGRSDGPERRQLRPSRRFARTALYLYSLPPARPTRAVKSCYAFSDQLARSCSRSSWASSTSLLASSLALAAAICSRIRCLFRILSKASIAGPTFPWAMAASTAYRTCFFSLNCSVILPAKRIATSSRRACLSVDAGPARSAAAPTLTSTETTASTPVELPDQPALIQAPEATPVARHVADEMRIDVAQVSGSGPKGRVTKVDVESYAGQAAPAEALISPQPAFSLPSLSSPRQKGTPVARPGPQEQDAPVAGPRAALQPSPTAGADSPKDAAQAAGLSPLSSQDAAGRSEVRQRMSRRRQTITRRLVAAQKTAAILTTFNEFNMSAIVDIRKRRRDTFAEHHGVSLGLTSFFVKASIGALKAFPRLNAEIQDADIILKRYYDIGIAVGAEEGLVVPVLRDADRMSFAEIEQQVKAFVDRAQKGTLTLENLRGGTFTITNGGVFGSLLSTPILNPPQVGILGLHKIEERPIALAGEVVIRPMMYVALSYDHRIVDGREAVQFLVRVKELIEEPESLLLEG